MSEKKIEKNNNQPEKDFAELLKERAGDGRIDESLQEIYQAEKATEAKTNLQRRRVDPLKRLAWTFAVFLILLAAVSWSGFYLLHQGERLRTEDVSFAIDGPADVVAGKEVVYELQYKNLSAFNLQNVEIRLQAPEHFIFIDAAPSPENPTALTWRLDQIETKRSGRIAVKGKLIDVVGATENFSATLSYRPENFSSTFRTDTSFAATMHAAGLSVSVEAPSYTNVGEELPLTVRYAKERESYIDAFSVLLQHGEHFVVSGGNKSGVWPVSKVADTQQELVLKGSYGKKPDSAEKLIVQLAIPEEKILTHDEGGQSITEQKTVYHVFYEQEAPVTVVDGALSLTLSLNGSLSGKPVNFGDELNYVIHYQNVSDAMLKNVVIMAAVDSPLVDWSTLKDENRGEQKDNALLWTKAEISDLAGIAPDKEGSFGFSLKVKNASAATAGNLAVRATLDYSIDSAPVSGATHAVELVNQINTDVTFNAQLRYFDFNNNAVGSGPLPPQAGQKTTYQVYWSVAADVHDLKDVSVSATLPAVVAWDNTYTASSGDISYAADTKTVTWSVPNVSAVGQPVLVQFAVSLTPAAGDRNKIITVMNQSNFQATDASTSGIIAAAIQPKTTNLVDDPIGQGQGQVQ
jgi:hypothetical protein